MDRESQLYDQLADILFGVKTAAKDEDLESKSERIKDEDLENSPFFPVKKLDGLEMDSNCCYTLNLAPLDYYGRLHRARHAQRFTYHYQFAYGRKICIPLGGEQIVCPSDYCFESTWVGVHGMQSICIVTRRDMDVTRLPPPYQTDSMKHQNMRNFAIATIAEVECLPHKDVAYYDDDFRRLSTGSAKIPFAVVSLAQHALEEFGDPYEVKKPVRKGINYLQSAPSEWLHTHYGIIRVAITAYQIMCDRKLRADDIWVTIMNVEPNEFDHLPMDIIAEQLDIINGLSSEKDPQKPLFEYRGPV